MQLVNAVCCDGQIKRRKREWSRIISVWPADPAGDQYGGSITETSYGSTRQQVIAMIHHTSKTHLQDFGHMRGRPGKERLAPKHACMSESHTDRNNRNN